MLIGASTSALAGPSYGISLRRKYRCCRRRRWHLAGEVPWPGKPASRTRLMTIWIKPGLEDPGWPSYTQIRVICMRHDQKFTVDRNGK